MANTKTSDLTVTTDPVSSDILYLIDNGVSKQATLSNISKGIVVTNLDVTGLTASKPLQVNSGGSAIESATLSGSDGTIITGTAGTNGNSAKWNADGDLVDGPALPSGTIVGTTDTQTLTNKTIIQKVVSYTPSAAATATLNVSTGGIHSITMPAGNITIAISNEAVGQCFIVEITQDSTGSRTVTWFSTIKWAGGSAPTLTTTGDKRDVFGFRVTGTDQYDGFVVGQNI